MMYAFWDIKRDGEIWYVTHIIFCYFGQFFTLLTPLPFPNNPKYQNFGKMKKCSGGIIILHKCTKNRMLHCSWDAMREVYNSYFSFWAILCPFALLLTTQNIKIFKKMIMITWCTAPEIWCVTDGRTEKVTYRGWCLT